MQRRNFIQAGFASLVALFSNRSSEAKPVPFVDPRRGSKLLGLENTRVCEWIDYSKKAPDEEGLVLLCCLDGKRKDFTTAYYIPYREVLHEDWITEEFPEFHDFEEETNTYWAPDGFYEYQSQSECHMYLEHRYYDYKSRDHKERKFFWMKLPKAPTA